MNRSRTVPGALAAAADGPPADDAPAMAAEATRMPKPRVSSRVLLGAGGELVIDHEGREYRLRITQNGKLILTA